MQNEIWYVIDINVKSEASEAIEFGLNEANADGTEINNLGKMQTESVRVTGYFENQPDKSFVENQLKEALVIYNFAADTISEIAWRTLGNIDWLYEWKKHWKPTETAKFIISPTWENFDKSEKKSIIYIDPAMAFGTGTHETTQLCIKAIEENYEPEMSFFDVGTGTGILAIAAYQIANSQKIRDFSPEVSGCDTHEDSIQIANQNAQLNNAEKIKFYAGSIENETPVYDFVCANLTIDVILPLLDLLLKKSKKIVVLSGILKEQEDDISKALKESAVKNFEIETFGMWISVVVKK